jgi:hypothetical protein
MKNPIHQTHMEANIKDFHLKYEGDKIVAWRFRFGDCESFADTLNEFKRRIPLEERIPNPDAAWLWEVKATQLNRNALDQIFDNFEMCLQTAESQMRLFG